MKNWIKQWLGIRNCNHICRCLSADEANKAVGELLQQYSATRCVQCNKPIIAHYGGFYRNSIGEVFCSHKCIDEHKATPQGDTK